MKKKIISLLIFLLAPVVVFADGAGVTPIEYKGFIINSNGTDVFDYNNKVIEHISYNTDVVVEDFYYIDNIKVLHIYYGNNNSGYVLDSDVGVYDEAVTPSDNDIYVSDDGKIVESYIYAYKDNVPVYLGPSSKYKTVGKLSKGEVVKTQMYLGYQYTYIEKGNLKGWVSTSLYENKEPGVVQIDDKNNITEKWEKKIAGVEFDVADPNNIDKTLFTLKCGDEYEISSYEIYTGRRNNSHRIRYQGQIGWTTSDNELEVVNSKIKTIITTEVHENTNESSKVVGTIPYNTEVISTKRVYDEGNELYSYYVEYNDIKGWINYVDYSNLVYNYFYMLEPDTDKYCVAPCYFDYESDYKHVYEPTDLYDIKTNKIIGKIDYNIDFEVGSIKKDKKTNKDKYYIIYKDDNNIYHEGYLLFPFNYDPFSSPTKYKIDYYVDENIPDIETTSIVRINKNTENIPKTSIKEIIIISVSFAILLTISSIILIRYLNKKKKCKENENEKGNN